MGLSYHWGTLAHSSLPQPVHIVPKPWLQEVGKHCFRLWHDMLLFSKPTLKSWKVTQNLFFRQVRDLFCIFTFILTWCTVYIITYQHRSMSMFGLRLIMLLFMLKMCLDFLTKPMLFANLFVFASHKVFLNLFRIQSDSERKYWPIRFVHTRLWTRPSESCICIDAAHLSVWGFTCKLHELDQQDWKGLCRTAI